MVSEILGGIGLFLVGMVLATDGLRVAAGEALRRALLRFTGGPVRALFTGAAVTALVQSSSATTVMIIGFVGAGLLSFEQAFGLILGANVGTTATGWIVATVGLKFSVTAVALPLVGAGALVRLFVRGRIGAAAMAVAGFGILFVGLDTLQGGMEGLAEIVTPDRFPDDTLLGRLALVGIGIAMTAILQSSSAAVATTITALHVGAISIEQAAPLVIGQNIGTTVTAGLASIGASTAAKRSAFAHFFFNFLIGILAFALLPFFLRFVTTIADHLRPNDATITLAAFHSAFNVIGVLLVLPFTRPFTRAVARIIRHRGPRLTRHLDDRITAMGGLAIETVRQTTIEIFQECVLSLERLLTPSRSTSFAAESGFEAAVEALSATEIFVGKLKSTGDGSEAAQRRHLSTLHALDHLRRLVETVRVHADVAMRHEDRESAAVRERVSASVRHLVEWCADPTLEAPTALVRASSLEIAERRRVHRAAILESTARGELDPEAAARSLEAVRRLDEVGYYLWRICEHLSGERLQTTTMHE